MKITNFWGDLTYISAKKEPLKRTFLIMKCVGDHGTSF